MDVIQPTQYSTDAPPPSEWRVKLERGAKIAGAVLGVALLGIPIVLVGSAYFFWPDIDRQLRATASSAAVIEPPVLEGRALTMLQRKFAAVEATSEATPFFTLSLAELNSAIGNMVNLGQLPQALPILRLEAERQQLKPRVLWRGPQFAGLMVACGFSQKSQLYGPVIDYLRQLEHFQLDIWLTPRAEQGRLTWDVSNAQMDGVWIPVSFVHWLQSKVLPAGNWFVIGPAHRPLVACRMTDQGLYLKWGPQGGR